MPHWFAVMAVGATIGFARKLVARYLHGAEIPQILEDPPEVRTVAKLELVEGTHLEVLAALAGALEPAVQGCTVVDDAVRGRHPGQGHEVDVVRIHHRAGAHYTLELTRAWTGPRIDDDARVLLSTIHQALVTHPAIRDVTWHWRQDKGLVVIHDLPVASPLVVS